MASMHYYLVFWSRRSTATVVPAANARQAWRRARARHKSGYGTVLSARQANGADRRLIRQGIWVRRRRDGSSPQFGSAAARRSARRQRSRYRPGL
jgi:hypothetical protein